MRKYLSFAFAVMIAAFSRVQAGEDSSQLDRWKRALAANDEYLHALQVLDRNVMQNAQTLIHNLRTKSRVNLEMAKYHSDEIGRSLATSDSYLTRLSKATDIAIDKIHLAFLIDLHSYYKKAIADHKQLQEELVKASPATSVLIMKALAIYSEMEKAGKEHIDLDTKMDIKEPASPTMTQ
jgi:hypothetical protein